MCVVAFAHHVHPRWRLLLAGNRDEFHARPTAALARWPGTGLLAGRDLVSGLPKTVVTSTKEVREAIAGHVLAQASLTGTYSLNPAVPA